MPCFGVLRHPPSILILPVQININESIARATDGVQQVAGVYSDRRGTYYAALWSGTAASMVSLQPTSLPSVFVDSLACGISGQQQVGAGSTAGVRHALLWSGTAGSAIDLNPNNLPNFDDSIAFNASGGQQVGYGYSNSAADIDHALLWHGSANSAIDLSPRGFSDSVAYGTNGNEQVGYAEIAPYANSYAMLWSGTPASAMNLQSLLPPGYTWYDSVAYTIDSAGNIFGTANYGQYAVE